MKSSFSIEKKPAVESEKYFCGEDVKLSSGEVLKEYSTAGRTWSFSKLFLLKNNFAIADRNVS